MRNITPHQAAILYGFTTSALKELMHGDWEAVREDVAVLHEILAVLARIES